jgi:uncharacterized protein (DUF433 family)
MSVTLDAEITCDYSVRGGEPVVTGTATPVRAIAELWNFGVPPEEIPVRLPHLALHQVFAALHYYLTHTETVDKYIAANRFPEAWSGKRFDPATGQVQ